MHEDGAGDTTPLGHAGSLMRKKWVYEQLLRTEQHFTAQVQNQQARIYSILTVNGFLLGFLASGNVIAIHPNIRWPGELFIVSLLLLAIALLVGLAALLPLLAIQRASSEPGERARKPLAGVADKEAAVFLDEGWFVADGISSGADKALDRLCRSIDNERHRQTLALRRKIIHAQLTLIFLAILTLIVALAGRLFTP